MLENIKLFATDNNRLSYEDSEDYIEPYVSLVEGDNNIYYNKSSRGGDPSEKTFDFACSIIEDNTKFILGNYDKGKINIDCATIDYNYEIIVASTDGRFVETQDMSVNVLKDIIARNVGKVEQNPINTIPVSGLNIGDEIPNFEKYTKCLWK